MSIIVFQHHDAERLGRLGSTLRDHAHKLDIRRPDRDGGDAIPGDLDNVRGVIALGGPQNVGDPEPWLAKEAEFLRKAHEAELPVVGICLGAQLLAHALGGTVTKMPSPEVGFLPVRVNPGPPQTEIMLAGVPWQSHVFHLHSWEISKAPPGAMVLQSSDLCKVQSFRAGLRTFGFQYHFEVDRPMIRAFCDQFAETLAEAGVSREAVQSQADTHYDRMAIVGDRLCANFATFAFPFSALTRA